MKLPIVLTFLSSLSMMVRLFLLDAIESPKKNPVLIFMGIFRVGISISNFIPTIVRGTPRERKKIIQANIFLFLFYFFFITMFIALIMLSY